ncbi:MAG TPA: Xaa-Pro peptidase family protein [Thermomicrobiaceae bacterium]|nr:Xaa-Pro peptidase family protein [Thermomicrobiaceae bacterium]
MEDRATGETPVVNWQTAQAEYDQRVAGVRAALEARELDALVLFHPIRMAYVSGFFHLTTERPMAIVVPLAGGLGALIPALEQEHIAKSPSVTRVKVYPEFPTGGTKHPMEHLVDLLGEMGLAGKRIGYDNNGGQDVNGYDGPELTALWAGHAEKARDVVDDLRMIKSERELAFIAESARWGNLAHRLMQERLALGRNEIDVALEASAEASRVMLAALGPTYHPESGAWAAPNPAIAMYHAGANTAFPHPLATSLGLQRGDVLVTGAGADVAGYQSELERTMVVGEPTDEFVRYFELMLQLQQLAFDALKPGRPLAEAETEVSRAFVELGVAAYQRHHTGHGIGLEGHEAPYIDRGDARVIRERMVFSVEPGIYVPGLAGFRHSDTVVIRAGGAERITYYPRDLAGLIVRL